MTATAPRAVRAVPVMLTAVAVALWAVGLSLVELDAMGPSGLISVLGGVLLSSYVVLAASLAWSLLQPVIDRRAMVLQLVVLVVMVHGLPSLLEAEAGYFTAYLHAGFVEEIARTGRTLPAFDARFAWPGAFALGALITDVAGLDGARFYLRWSPVFFNLAYLAPLRMIARSVTKDERAQWLGLVLFVVANWVHQDYFSPQALALFGYLVVLAVVLRWFGRGDVGPGLARGISGRRRLAALDSTLVEWADRDQAEGEPIQPEPAQAWLLILVVVVIAAATVMSHQLTPINMLLVFGALIAVRRCAVRNLPWVLALLVGGWFAVGATGYWLGHLDELLGGAGEVSENLGKSIGGRVEGSDGRTLVLRLRMVMAATMLAAAGLAALRRFRRGTPPLALLACLVPPFLLVGGQSYGGEVILRSYLFSLPATVLLVATLAASSLAERRFDDGRPPTVTLVLGTALIAVLTVAGLTARYGNEQFEVVRPSELAAVEWVYDEVPLGANVAAANRNLPWRYQDLAGYRFIPMGDEVYPTADDLVEAVIAQGRAGRDNYFVATGGQEVFGRELYGLEPGWLAEVESDLIDSDRAELVFADGRAHVYRLLIDPEAGS